MALIVEDGTGVADAEALCTVEQADEYHESRGNTAAWMTLDTPDKEAHIRKGYDYMLERYAARWPDGEVFGVITTDDVGAVPTRIRYANASLALKSKTGSLSPELTPQKIKTKVGPLETEYAPRAATTGARSFPDVDGLVVPYLESPNPYSMTLERS